MSQTEAIDLGIDGLSTAVHLGAGGSANVFAARDLETGEQVAVKLLRASADSDNERKRFDREKEALHKLSTRDGIVSVLDSGITDRREPYFLMPLMQGSLQDRLETSGPLEWESAAQLMIEVAETVEFAHSQQVLHRDLKPGNILLDDDGVPSVSDFGIAKLLDSSVSKSSKSLGTPSFMPPERFKGEEATASSDVYGLGATLASLITGSAPFLTGENDTDAAVMMRVVTEEPPSLEEFGVPAEIAGVVASSMAKDASARPESAAEFARQLREAMTAVGATPPEAPLTIAVPRRNLTIPETNGSAGEDDGHMNRMAWLVAAALLLVFGVAGALVVNRGGDDPVDVEVASEQELPPADDAEADGDDGSVPSDAENGDSGSSNTQVGGDTATQVEPDPERLVLLAGDSRETQPGGGADPSAEASSAGATAAQTSTSSPTAVASTTTTTNPATTTNTPTTATTNAPTTATTNAPTTATTNAPTTATTYAPTTTRTPVPTRQDKSRTLTINNGGYATQGYFLSSGGTSLVPVSGSLRGSISNGTYTHTREQDSAYSFSFVIDELNSHGRALARWTVTVTVSSNGNAVDPNCPDVEIQDLAVSVESSSVAAITWTTNTEATERVTSAPHGGPTVISRQSGNYYVSFTHRLGDVAWSGVGPLLPGTSYSATVSVTSRCNPGDSTSSSVSFTTPE